MVTYGIGESLARVAFGRIGHRTVAEAVLPKLLARHLGKGTPTACSSVLSACGDGIDRMAKRFHYRKDSCLRREYRQESPGSDCAVNGHG